jgi:hypothetical protein
MRNTRRPHRRAVGPWNIGLVGTSYFVNSVSPGTLSSLLTIRFSARLAAFIAVWSTRSRALLPVSLPSCSLVSTASCDGRAADLLELIFCSISPPPADRNVLCVRRLPLRRASRKTLKQNKYTNFSVRDPPCGHSKWLALQTTKSPPVTCTRPLS